MEKRKIENSELVLTGAGQVYHLHLKPGDIADTVFLVGDPGRVKLMSSLFDSVELRVENREFVTHTGTYRGKRVSVLSTGIGTDNIDIVVNELDTLVNIDLEQRTVRENLRSLNLIRLGTSGALHADIAPGSVIVAEVAGGLDNLMHFYAGLEQLADVGLGAAFATHMQWNPENSRPYFIPASGKLVNRITREAYFRGITLSAPGFYAPQGRSLRMDIQDKQYVEKISSFRYGSYRINNFEMEGSALYGLATRLGHEALTVCIALANRSTGEFITDYQVYVKQLLSEVLDSASGDDE
ncbi:MAG: nucleoside phosphorylase [Bacteroidales bacterium]|nr:nucleoside phosphorylase [Bacteroidales bacterium]MDT8431708.1 nucleoside phosphorylase [Bacteroidales bacterium]